MDHSKCEETSCLQLFVLYSSCQGERMLCMRQGTRWVIPQDACDLCLVPLRFRQRFLIVTDLYHLVGLLQQRLHPGLVERVLGCQDRQAVEGHANQPGHMLLLRIG